MVIQVHKRNVETPSRRRCKIIVISVLTIRHSKYTSFFYNNITKIQYNTHSRACDGCISNTYTINSSISIWKKNYKSNQYTALLWLQLNSRKKTILINNNPETKPIIKLTKKKTLLFA